MSEEDQHDPDGTEQQPRDPEITQLAVQLADEGLSLRHRSRQPTTKRPLSSNSASPDLRP
jgi:hypothetical protein